MQLPYIDSPLKAGFPSPALDYIARTIDICDFLIDHPNSTFIMQISGDSMEGKYLYDGDFVVVDKSLEGRSGKIVIAEIDGKFTCKELRYNAQGNIYLRPHNKKYKDIYPSEGETMSIWGVVIGSFRKI